MPQPPGRSLASTPPAPRPPPEPCQPSPCPAATSGAPPALPHAPWPPLRLRAACTAAVVCLPEGSWGGRLGWRNRGPGYLEGGLRGGRTRLRGLEEVRGMALYLGDWEQEPRGSGSTLSKRCPPSSRPRHPAGRVHNLDLAYACGHPSSRLGRDARPRPHRAPRGLALRPSSHLGDCGPWPPLLLPPECREQWSEVDVPGCEEGHLLPREPRLLATWGGRMGAAEERGLPRPCECVQAPSLKGVFVEFLSPGGLAGSYGPVMTLALGMAFRGEPGSVPSLLGLKAPCGR